MSSDNLIVTETYKNDEVKILNAVVIVGNGPVGLKAAELIESRDPNVKVIIFGEENCQPYNRVQLSQYLAGEVAESDLLETAQPRSKSVTQFVGRKVVEINPKLKVVIDDSGQSTKYSKLILATGSNPVIPNIPNTSLKGVHQFRTLQDTNRLLSEKETKKKFYIVGGGPLGLETAMALKTPNNQVTLDVRSKLLNQNFSEQAQTILKDYINASGIEVVQGNPIASVCGAQHVEAVELTDGARIACDCLIFCVGVRPETSLAKQANLAVRNGIVVDKNMRTSAPDIYAIGECCEFEFSTFGVVAPGFKQAAACVEDIFGSEGYFEKEEENVQVKFSDYTTAYFGELDVEGSQTYTYSNRLKGIYRKLVVLDGHLVGAIIIGNWDEQNDIRAMLNDKTKLKHRQYLAFQKNGTLLREQNKTNIKELPEDYIICLCQNITRGQLSQEIESGCRTVEILGEKTKAGTVCGSCKPLLLNLLDTPAPNLVMRHQKAILYTSIFSIIAILALVFFEPLSIADSVQFSWHIEKLWFDPFWKQVSGFTLLGFCFIATALAARKRIKRFNVGHVDSWRFAHSIIGVGALFVLMIHTGMRLGNNLNFALMFVFLLATTTGSLVGVFMARNHHWSDLKLRKHRLWWSRVHYSLLWMLPPLIFFHILSAYYF
ncbi:FAD-dependent oxidoreductase [Aliikangiella sp. IMCC44653]